MRHNYCIAREIIYDMPIGLHVVRSDLDADVPVKPSKVSEAGVLIKLINCAEPAMEVWTGATDTGNLIAETREDIGMFQIDCAMEGELVAVELDVVGGVVNPLGDDDGWVEVGHVLVFVDHDLALHVGCRFAIYDFVCAWRIRMLIARGELRLLDRHALPAT